MTYQNGLFIFHRDLRLLDNSALIRAAKECATITPCFIFDKEQITIKNKFRSTKALRFMLASLQDLDLQLQKYNARLYCFFGTTSTVVEHLLHKKLFDAVYSNCDYTPFALKRDTAITEMAQKYHVPFIQEHDALLNEPKKVTKSDGSPYIKFTPFFNKALHFVVAQQNTKKIKQWYTKQIAQSFFIDDPEIQKYFPLLEPPIIKGGSKEGQKILKNIVLFRQYKNTHDIPAHPTTHLSAHLKFGTLSVRTTYHAIGKALGYRHPLIRQLYWRDFFTAIAYYFPHVFTEPFHKQYTHLAWSNDETLFKKWCAGMTGFPLIDAGMRELNQTGFMHNRVRMIVASFLVKNVHINWQWGERYFAQQLVDYDPAVNNGNWQWCASTGCDAQPYFRIFNPWIQQKKYDPECVYIKTWVPELRTYSPKIIHQWNHQHSHYTIDYPSPIVNHQITSAYAKQLFSSLKKQKNK